MSLPGQWHRESATSSFSSIFCLYVWVLSFFNVKCAEHLTREIIRLIISLIRYLQHCLVLEDFLFLLKSLFILLFSNYLLLYSHNEERSTTLLYKKIYTPFYSFERGQFSVVCVRQRETWTPDRLQNWPITSFMTIKRCAMNVVS